MAAPTNKKLGKGFLKTIFAMANHFCPLKIEKQNVIFNSTSIQISLIGIQFETLIVPAFHTCKTIFKLPQFINFLICIVFFKIRG